MAPRAFGVRNHGLPENCHPKPRCVPLGQLIIGHERFASYDLSGSLHQRGDAEQTYVGAEIQPGAAAPRERSAV
eukprot:9487407-Pyramimonas_sp.AAC.1